MEDLDVDEISKIVVDAAYHIHTTLGPGLLESVYEAVLAHELTKRGLEVNRQVPVEVVYDGITIGEGFRADMLVNGQLLIELKSVERMQPVYFKQVRTYLKLMNLRVGLMFNFGAATIKSGTTRVVNEYDGEFATRP